MAIIKGKGQQTTSVARVSEGADVYLKALRDGTMTMADWVAALSLEGRIFTANAGTATTPITFGSTGLSTTEFDFHVAVPSGSVIIPLDLRVEMEVFGTSYITEIVMQSGKGSVVGAGTSITPVCSNTNTGRTSSCTITAAATTSSGTAFTSENKEIFRAGYVLSVTPATAGASGGTLPTVFTWRAKDSGILDVVGPSAQIGIWASSQAGTGFICLKYAELPYSAVS